MQYRICIAPALFSSTEQLAVQCCRMLTDIDDAKSTAAQQHPVRNFFPSRRASLGPGNIHPLQFAKEVVRPRHDFLNCAACPSLVLRTAPVRLFERRLRGGAKQECRVPLVSQLFNEPKD